MTSNSIKPSQIKHSPWVYVIESPNTITIDKIKSDEYIHDNFENIVSYKFINDKCLITLNDNNEYGKFMLWYNKNIIDQKWKLATDLFHSNKLKNIVTMKCSTSMNNPNAYNEDESVILLYCVDSDKKELRKIAKNIINLFNYDHKSIISYKTNIHTKKGGNYKPYSIKNHLYKKCKNCKNKLNNSLEKYKNKCKSCMVKDGELHIYTHSSKRNLTELIVQEKYKEDCPFCGIINCNCGSGY